MSEKRYTAQELRQTAGMDFYATKLGLDDRLDLTNEIRAMLHQSADAEEENAKLRETINADSASMAGTDAVIEQLKARLEEVVNEREKSAHSLAIAEECINKCYANVTNRSRTPSDACLDIANIVREYRKTNAQAKKGEGGAE